MFVVLAVGCGPSVPGPEQRLPPLKTDPFAGLDPLVADAPQPFTFRKGPAPPPSVSERVKMPFPPPAASSRAVAPAAPELAVLRYQPQGKDKLVGAVTVTFNQAMVPVTSLSLLGQQQVPLTIQPSVPGRYRWLGTRTLTFEPQGRMPLGTRYVAEVPAGVRGESGKMLEKPLRWEFSTPLPALESALPSRHSTQVKPDTALAFLFNQKIKGERLLRHLKLGARSGKDFRLVPGSAWAALKYVGETVSTWDPDRTVVVQPATPLPLAATQRVEISQGLIGEGPLPTRTTLFHSFSTYGPLKVERVRCAGRRCEPQSGFQVILSNPLVTTDPAKYVNLAPAPQDLEIKGSGRYLNITALFAPRTKYTITVSPGLEDIHRQKLTSPSSKILTTGDLYPCLAFPARGYAVLEHRGKHQVPLMVTSVEKARMRMVRVQRKQLLQVIKKARYSWDDNGRKDPLKGIKGLVVKRTLRTNVPINGRAKVGISTDEGLGRGKPGVLYIELRSEELKRFYTGGNPFRGLVVSVTDIGLLVRYDHDKILVLATGLKSGKPLDKVELELRDNQGEVIWTGRTGPDGTATLPGRRQYKQRSPYVVWAQRGRDHTFAILDSYGVGAGHVYSYGTWSYPPARKRLKMLLFTDRSPYRPGEKVHIKGALRIEDTSPSGGIEPVVGLKEAKVRVNSPRGRKVLELDQVPVSESGAFDLDVDLPADADLGNYSVFVSTQAGSGHGRFSVEAYRAPEFAVKVGLDDPVGSLFFGDTLQATIQGDYLFGAPMAGAQVSWTLRRTAASYSPPHNGGFTFSERLPYWSRWRFSQGRRGGRHGSIAHLKGAAGSIIARGRAVLDAQGRLQVSRKLEPDPESDVVGPASFTLEGQVVDQNRQSISNRQVALTHPASVYIGLRPQKSVVKAGEPLDVSAVLTGLDGGRIPGKTLRIRALQLKHRSTPVKGPDGWRYQWQTQEEEVAACGLKTAASAASCALILKRPGAYLLRSSFKDPQGRLARTTMRIYAYGPGYVPWRLQNQSRAELVPDKESYEPGETARVLVKSPLDRSLGLLTVSRAGIMQHRVLQMKGNARVLEIPITEHCLPGIHVGVALARGRIKDTRLGRAAEDLGRPTLAHGTVRLPVSLERKRISLKVEPAQQSVRPSGTFDLRLHTADSQGKPVSGEVAVMVVDEGVLSLLGYKTPDPLNFFWSPRAADTGLQDNRNSLLKQELNLKKLSAEASRYGPRGGNGGARPMVQRRMPLRSPLAPPAEASSATSGVEMLLDGASAGKMAKSAAPRIRSRAFFATTAYYNPSVVTDAKGQAVVKIKMPDNLTTFRIMAVALDRGQADRFGKGEAQIKVRKPLLLRPSLPRFLSVGDTFEAAVMVHNETAAAGLVDVLVRGRNVEPLGATRKRVRIDAHRAAEVRFPLRPLGPGPVRLQFAAVLGAETDAVEKQLPALLPVTTEAFAVYGVTDTSTAQSVLPPKDALPGYGGLDISLSSTALNGLEDAVRFLVDYPHECTEQTASRLLPIFGLKDILRDFKIGKLSDQKTQQALARAGVRKLLRSQRWDGGWGMWEGSRISWPYLTAYAVFTLQRARENGHEVDKYKMDRAARFLKRLLDHPRKELGEQYAHTTQALSVWALSDLERHEPAHLSRLYGLRHKLPLFARAMLMQAIHRAARGSKQADPAADKQTKELLRELNNAAVESASAAHFAEVKTESLRLLMHSEDRTDAIVLYALLEVDPAHPLILKLARGLIQARVKGAWSTTQANAYALSALARYYHQVEKVVPDYAADLWLGEKGYLGRAVFKGRQLRVVQQHVPLETFKSRGREELVLSKSGPGKLYYRVGLRYAPTNLRLGPEEQGFSVSRTYEPVEGDKDSVQYNKDGSWSIKAGATVRVRLTVVAPDQRYFVAVIDPLPAGLEAVNLKFKTSATSRLGNQLGSRAYDFHSWYSLLAFDHQEQRDESVVLFADRLPSGVYEYTYLARATTLGRFIAAPTRAEEMYRPETFGRAGTTVVEVR